MVDKTRALSFGSVADSYRRYRPRTPAAALDWIVPPGTERALDLAAGTGALTEVLVTRVPSVTAVEPDPGMREVLAVAVPQADVREGTGEAIPLDDSSVDLACVASAWHWLDPQLAVPELARVLRDGGRLVVLGNVIDRRVPWIAALRDAARRSAGRPRAHRDQVTLPDDAPFGPSERHELTWTQEMSVDDVVGLLGTYSDVIVATPEERARVLDAARAVLDAKPTTRGRERLEVPVRTWLWRAQRLPRSP